MTVFQEDFSNHNITLSDEAIKCDTFRLQITKKKSTVPLFWTPDATFDTDYDVM